MEIRSDQSRCKLHVTRSPHTSIVCYEGRQSWEDSVIIHTSHLVIPSVTFRFPLSQLLPVLLINPQCQCFCNSPWPWVTCPLSFVLDVIPTHFEDAPVLRPRQQLFVMQLWDFTVINKNLHLHTLDSSSSTALNVSVAGFTTIFSILLYIWGIKHKAQGPELALSKTII